MSFAPNHNGKVAVIDSGVGGLSVVAELRLMLPNNSVNYYADTKNCPYGAKTREEITTLTLDVVSRVVEMGARVVVVACNTMTAAAIGLLRQRWGDVEFVGMEPAIKPAILSSKSKVVGVLATRATLKGELYRLTKKCYGAGTEVIEIAGDGLVEFVEQERYFSGECKELLRGYIKEMVERGADEIVLGCTHYPFLSEVIEDILDELQESVEPALRRKVEIINPASAVAQRARELAECVNVIESEGVSEVCYYSSGDAEDLDILRNFLENYQSRREKWRKIRQK